MARTRARASDRVAAIITAVLPSSFNLSRPGLFITATDTEVGKTVVTCALAAHLREAGLRVGVCKPLASGCRRDREGLVSEDAEALAHFADCRHPLSVICPLRFVPPVAPAVAAEAARVAIDFQPLADSLHRIAADCDIMIIEGVGGLLAPIDPSDPKRTVLDLIKAIGYPAIVVTRASLGTLNHTTMTVRLLRDAGCAVAGLIVNGYDPDSGDAAMATNRDWLAKMTGRPVLATVSQTTEPVAPHRGLLPRSIIEAMGTADWPRLARAGRAAGR